MADRRFSGQTLSLLSALEHDPTVWRHGYELAKETGLGPRSDASLPAGWWR